MGRVIMSGAVPVLIKSSTSPVEVPTSAVLYSDGSDPSGLTGGFGNAGGKVFFVGGGVRVASFLPPTPPTPTPDPTPDPDPTPPTVEGIPLSELAEGDIVSMAVNGVTTTFFVVKHNYESELNGSGRTLLLAQNSVRPVNETIPYSVAFGSPYTYAKSDLDKWLQETYLPWLPQSVQNRIGQTAFYCYNANNDGRVTSIQRAVFVPSFTEFKLTNNSGKSVPTEGTAFDIADTLLRNNNYEEWTRTMSNQTEVPYEYAFRSYSSGVVKAAIRLDGDDTPTSTVRPCFTLPCDTLVNATSTSGLYSLIE